MSGILDNKERIIDAFVTLEGRRQIANGDLRVEHVSFTDGGTYYRGDLASGSADATDRIFFECCNLPQDQITFEADDSGNLQPFGNESEAVLRDGRILTYSFAATSGSLISGSNESTTFLTGSEFASLASSLLPESLEHFKKLQVVSTKDILFEDTGFGVGNNETEFVLTSTRPIRDPSLHVADLDQTESLFNDPRLSRVKNFDYLPPINRMDDDSMDKADYRATRRNRLGNYKPWGRTHRYRLKHKHIKYELDYYERLGFMKTFRFDPTSRENSLVGQFFEQGRDRLRKLDVIDYGTLRTGNPDEPLAHIFFVGRLLVDANDTHSFVHLFTLVFG